MSTAVYVLRPRLALPGGRRLVVTLSDAGLEARTGGDARFVRWDDVVGVRCDGGSVALHVHDGRALVVTAPRSTDPRWRALVAEVPVRLDASRGYSNRPCDVDAGPAHACQDAMGCAGSATCLLATQPRVEPGD